MKAPKASSQWLLLGALAAWLFLIIPGNLAFSQEQEEQAQAQASRAYVMSNLAGANTIIVYSRTSDGMLTKIQEVPTGGFGSGPGILPPPLPPFPGPIPLDSQDAIVLTQDGRFLLAVNPDSNEISSFAVTREGLRLADKISSGGSFPVSISEHRGLVYVANAGQSPDEFIGSRPSIAGFRLDRLGKFHEIPNSRVIAGGPDASAADLVFSPDGHQLVMTELNGNNVDVFQVSEDGRAHDEVTIPANNRTPFAAQFRPDGVLTIAETNDISRRLQVDNGASLSTYKLSGGKLIPVSKAVPNNQSAACWVRFTPDGHFAFTINAGSGTISTFSISPAGVATVLTEVTADTGGPFSLPIDTDLTPDGKFLYVISALEGLHGVPQLPLPLNVSTIQIYSIGSDGSLTRIGTVDGLPFTVEGIVVR